MSDVGGEWGIRIHLHSLSLSSCTLLLLELLNQLVTLLDPFSFALSSVHKRLVPRFPAFQLFPCSSDDLLFINKGLVNKIDAHVGWALVRPEMATFR